MCYYLVSNLTFSFETQRIFNRVHLLEISIISKIVVYNLVVLWLKINIKVKHMGYLIGLMVFIFEYLHYYKNGQNTGIGGSNGG